MKLDVYVVEQSMSNLSFILSQHKQGRKYYALTSSPLTTCQNWYDTRSDRLDVLHAIINKVVLLKCTKSQTCVTPNKTATTNSNTKHPCTPTQLPQSTNKTSSVYGSAIRSSTMQIRPPRLRET